MFKKIDVYTMCNEKKQTELWVVRLYQGYQTAV